MEEYLYMGTQIHNDTKSARIGWVRNSGCGGGQRVVGQKCAPSDVLMVGLANRLPDSKKKTCKKHRKNNMVGTMVKIMLKM